MLTHETGREQFQVCQILSPFSLIIATFTLNGFIIVECNCTKYST